VGEKLRKKRCDDVAAVLQQAAQELGGQAVAELALDAGDRCRSLGKRNAALNCYLAASRADPIYEPPWRAWPTSASMTRTSIWQFHTWNASHVSPGCAGQPRCAADLP